MANNVKITEDGFKIGIGFMLAVAVSLAFGRIYVRAKLNHKFYVDDGFFSLAVVTLIAGTIMTYLDIPYIYLQQNVQAGSQAPPADFIQQLLTSVKIQNAAVVLLSTTVFAIKLAFLTFFRGLIRRLKKLEIWWWYVLVIVILSSIFLICANFITCPYYDERTTSKDLGQIEIFVGNSSTCAPSRGAGSAGSFRRTACVLSPWQWLSRQIGLCNSADVPFR